MALSVEKILPSITPKHNRFKHYPPHSLDMTDDYLVSPPTNQYAYVVDLLYAYHGRYHSDSQDLGNGVEYRKFGGKSESTDKTMEETAEELKGIIREFPNRAEASRIIWGLLVERDGNQDQEFHVPSIECQRFWGTYCAILEKVDEEEVKADAELMAARYLERGNLKGLAVVLDGMSKHLDKKTIMEVAGHIAQNDNGTYNPVAQFIKDVLDNRKGLGNKIGAETLVEIIGMLLKTHNFSAVSESLRGTELDGWQGKRDAMIKKLFDDYMVELLNAGKHNTAHSMAYQLVKTYPGQARRFLEHCASDKIRDGHVDGLYYLVSFASSPMWYESEENPNYYVRRFVESAFKTVIERLAQEADGQEKPALEYVREKLEAAVERCLTESGSDYVRERIRNAFVRFKEEHGGIVDSGAVAGRTFHGQSKTPAAHPAARRIRQDTPS